mmetsp:Transcript_23330/g.64729  ORF Transcript_23330/g.64729 Transcript_23330/m.64729 type:complete len:323 (+) Transcript_23330:255-1223(+)|eukprot:CAMPEP_0172381612 /NCGR_PEP_ID=MMETSP1060-20121228/71039_1 /TAXON_ID=37318 /ORGANISM="Pseudo-nitzschia pungens, Strain cf. cingulata" /LENGTH=322 /DNA_ID=CAMNT_0013109395 /DNA_START=199 /DNA_END=1167 /DNA_ORIENTATION=-
MGIMDTLLGDRGLVRLWILLAFTLQLFWNLQYNNNPTEVQVSESQAKVQTEKKIEDGKPTIVYGHLHMTKTGGSNINGLLAAKYDNVCGNKGNSYNAYKVNEKRMKKETDYRKGRQGIPFSKYRKEVGFENCDYISIETKWDDWKKHIVDALEFENRNMKLELHVPCRDPVDHLLSLCNHRGKTFQCPDINDEEAIAHEIKNCLWIHHGTLGEKPKQRLVRRARYDPKLKTHSEHLDVKCFQNFPIENYVNYVGQFLRPRRIEAPFVDRKTNKDREKEKECLLAQDENYRATVKRLVLDLEFMGYYKFCEECIGSSDELKLT